MLINELDEKIDLKEIDLLDDLEFFMRNDSNFYRRVFYPLIAKIRDHVKQDKKCKDTVFRSCIDKAIPIYFKKFNLPGNEKSVFTDVDRDDLARKIFGQEIDHIRNGHYDGDKQ